MRRFRWPMFILLLWFLPAECPAAATLEALPEFLRPDPFGGIVKPDQGGERLRSSLYGAHHRVALKGWRGGYVSFQMVVKSPAPATYSLDVSMADPTHKIQTDLFREWFHFTDSDKRYYPDALVPTPSPYSSRLPEPDNKIDQQTAQAFWVDVYIPADARPGVYGGKARLKCGRSSAALALQLTVLDRLIPPEDVVTIDHNSYGSNFLAEQYYGHRHYSGNWCLSRSSRVANATFFATTAPIWVVVFGWLILRQRVAGGVLAGLGLCLLGGSALLAQSFELKPAGALGDAFGIATGVFFGLFLAVQAARKTASAARLTFEATLITAAILSSFTLLAERWMLPRTDTGHRGAAGDGLDQPLRRAGAVVDRARAPARGLLLAGVHVLEAIAAGRVRLSSSASRSRWIRARRPRHPRRDSSARPRSAGPAGDDAALDDDRLPIMKRAV